MRNMPGIEGSFQVLNSHAPKIANLRKGIVVVKNQQKNEKLDENGGIVGVLNNKVIVLV